MEREERLQVREGSSRLYRGLGLPIQLPGAALDVIMPEYPQEATAYSLDPHHWAYLPEASCSKQTEEPHVL